MNASPTRKPELTPSKILALLVIWAASSVILQLLTGASWWMSVIGGIGAVSLALSTMLPATAEPASDALSDTESEPEPEPEAPDKTEREG